MQSIFFWRMKPPGLDTAVQAPLSSLSNEAPGPGGGGGVGRSSVARLPVFVSES